MGETDLGGVFQPFGEARDRLVLTLSHRQEVLQELVGLIVEVEGGAVIFVGVVVDRYWWALSSMCGRKMWSWCRG